MSFEIELVVGGESIDVEVDALPPISTAITIGDVDSPLCLVTSHDLYVTEEGTSRYSVFTRRVGKS